METLYIFQSTSLSRGKTHNRSHRIQNGVPSNPLPSQEGTPAPSPRYCLISSFNPLPSHEGRHWCPIRTMPERAFQSTSLSRGKTRSGLKKRSGDIFQSTSLSRGKTWDKRLRNPWRDLSIHFPLTREDMNTLGNRLDLEPFNPLPSHEGRPDKQQWYAYAVHFQSTSLSRGKTKAAKVIYYAWNLSIHFPLTREDKDTLRQVRHLMSFNPLPSHEGRRPSGFRSPH